MLVFCMNVCTLIYCIFGTFESFRLFYLNVVGCFCYIHTPGVRCVCEHIFVLDC